MDIPVLIKRVRSEAHLSQDAFAKLLGVSRTTINRWEMGNQEPSALALKVVKDFCVEQGIEFQCDTV